MELLSEEICLEREQNLGTLDLPEIEALGLGFLGCSHDRIAERRNMGSELLCVVNDLG
jgi:hypothetical protein